MRYLDIKPEPTDSIELWRRWINNMQTSFNMAGIDLFKKRVKVQTQTNDEDWEFVFIDRGNGVKGMAVF